MMTGSNIILQGSASDPDGDPIIGWHWELDAAGNGSPSSLAGATTPNPTFTAESPGAYVLTLVVDDGVESSEPDFTIITVASNRQPVAVAEADQTSGPAPLTVNFNGIESTEPDFQPLTYYWDFGDSNAGEGPRVTHRYSVPGTYLVTLAAADDYGKFDLATLEILVTGDNTSPAVEANPTQNIHADEEAVHEDHPGAGNRVSQADASRVADAAAVRDAIVNESAASENVTTTGQLKNDLLALTVRVNTLVASIAELEDKLSALQTVVDSMTTPIAAGTTESATAAEIDTPDSSKAVIKESGVSDRACIASTRMSQAKTENSGPWAINLASIRDKADADRFAGRMESKGAHVQLSRALVRGTEFWRVQITGFQTAREASDHAAALSERLGLTGVWITKH
jgi:PKD repeat protein